MTEPILTSTLPPPPSSAGAGGPPSLGQLAASPARAHWLQFTGSGGEYFRIWIVNLALTIVTLGIYSAWAKVRKVRYFYSNTRLDGVSFQYHGRPWPILRGRLLAAALFAAYAISGAFSVTAGLTALAVLALLFPWFFHLAMRFRLANSSWGGLRFGFASRPWDSYVALLPAVVVWLAFMITAPRQPVPKGELPPGFGLFIALELLFVALLPYFHARLKRYQLGATTFGALRFTFEKSSGAFYGLYFKTGALTALPFIAIAVLVGLTSALFLKPKAGSSGAPILVAAFVILMVLAYAFSIAFYFSRMMQLVWSKTRGGPLTFESNLSARGFAKVIFKVGFLTLVTLGLYWPWAAVALVRAQVESLSVTSGEPLASLTAGERTAEGSAAGDGALDLFGLDFGL